MRYYVDTEFNGTEGQLISIALVRQDGAEFYAVLDMYQIPQPWVAEHVLPQLWLHTLNPTQQLLEAACQRQNKSSYQPVWSREQTKKQLRKFLEKDSTPVTFVGDWPEDLVHISALLLRGHGKRNPPEQFRCLMLSLPGFDTATVSAVPHNALEDARVLRAFVEQGITDGAGGALTTADLALLRGT